MVTLPRELSVFPSQIPGASVWIGAGGRTATIHIFTDRTFSSAVKARII